MSKELETYRLERTVISQAYELADLRERSLTQNGQYQEAEKRYQAEKDRADRYGGLIHTIGSITNDDELSYEEQVTTIQTLVNQWEEQENYEQNTLAKNH